MSRPDRALPPRPASGPAESVPAAGQLPPHAAALGDTPAEPGGDPRVARTRAELVEALLAECAERPLEKVSVAAVVRRAGVGRATFYLHYPDLSALAVDACAGFVRRAVAALHAWEGPAPANAPAALVEFFTAVAAHADVHRTLLHPGGAGPLGELLHRELREYSTARRAEAGAPAPELIGSAVAATFTGVFADWLHGAVAGTAAEIAEQTWRLLLALHATPLP